MGGDVAIISMDTLEPTSKYDWNKNKYPMKKPISPDMLKNIQLLVLASTGSRYPLVI